MSPIRRDLRLALGVGLLVVPLAGCSADLSLDLSAGASCSEQEACDPGLVCFNTWCVGEGEMRVSLTFDVDSDFDLHVVTPSGQEIAYDHRTADGGELDVDQCVFGCGAGPHVENVVFADTPSEGNYEVFVRNYDPRAAGPFTIDVVTDETALVFDGELPQREDADSETFAFTWPLASDGAVACGTAGTCAADQLCLRGGDDCVCDTTAGALTTVARPDACVPIPEACASESGPDQAECVAGSICAEGSAGARPVRTGVLECIPVDACDGGC